MEERNGYVTIPIEEYRLMIERDTTLDMLINAAYVDDDINYTGEDLRLSTDAIKIALKLLNPRRYELEVCRLKREKEMKKEEVRVHADTV